MDVDRIKILENFLGRLECTSWCEMLGIEKVEEIGIIRIIGLDSVLIHSSYFNKIP